MGRFCSFCKQRHGPPMFFHFFKGRGTALFFKNERTKEDSDTHSASGFLGNHKAKEASDTGEVLRFSKSATGLLCSFVL